MIINVSDLIIIKLTFGRPSQTPPHSLTEPNVGAVPPEWHFECIPWMRRRTKGELAKMDGGWSLVEICMS